MMIFALVASSLNLVLGFGGMMCFGHAAFFGVGAYTVAIMMHSGIDAAWLAWPAALLVTGGAAWLIGMISLRTRGVYFIMITLAFAQMLHYIFVSLRDYGGDDGMPLVARSTLPFGLDLSSDTTFFYTVFGILAVVMVLLNRLVNARFGRVLQAIRENETRMEAVGYPVYQYKLIAFVIAGAIAGLAGALIANQNGMVSPSLMYWTQSGSLMIMVILGGVGYVYGGVLGAFLLLLLEEILSGFTIYWQLPLGIILLVVVLFARNGVLSLFGAKRHG
jgi:branched-chain amino acid transport system permease protein